MNMAAWFLSLPLLQQLLFIYFLLINVITFFYFGIDKLKSQLDNRRVRERTLWLLAAIGGSIGALLGMYFFRHKTKKMSFQAGVAMIIVIQILLTYLTIMNR